MVAPAPLLAAGKAVASPPEKALHLDVMLGGQSIGLLGSFVQRADGSFVVQRKELEELGIRAPPGARPDEAVPLSAIPGLAYRYDEAAQSIDFQLPEAARLPRIYDARPDEKQAVTGGYSATGAVLNYTLFGASDGRQPDDFWRVPNLSATLDARLFGTFGVLSQTGILSSHTQPGSQAEALRLETGWSYSDPASMLSYRAGDTISGGLAWTRPIRLGGAQIQRNFALRPDLVTLPLPSLSGSASVPSTVDVLVNGIRTVSQDVGSGPFRITNLPILSGNGNASIVVRDASGQQTETTLPFVVSSKLLRPGLLDFSAEIGMPRLEYGLRSSVYSEDVAASGSARYGLSDRLTLLTHAEATRSFGAGSFGAVLGLGSLGLLTAAATGSWRDGATGGQAYAAFESSFGSVSFLASSQRSFGNYQDLASVASLSQPGAGGLASGLSDYVAGGGGLAGSGLWSRSLLPPRALDRLSIGVPVPTLGGGLNLGITHLRDTDGTRNRIVNASYTRAIKGGGSFYATVFADLDDRRSSGLFAGITVPLGGDVFSSGGFSRSGSTWQLAAEIAKPLRLESGSIGWRIRDVEGGAGQMRRSASLGYRGDKAQIEGSVAQTDAGFSGTAQLDGAIVLAGGGLFLANRIDDAFAIAKVGAPDVDVLFENRVVARTDRSGNALVPMLRSYQANQISIDPRGLPLTAVVENTQEVLAPPDRAGVVVDFGTRSIASSAVVILHDGAGKPLQAGLRANLRPDLRGVESEGPSFTIGYDGRAFIDHLGPDNTLAVQVAGGSCTARFPFTPRDGEQVVIGPVPCR